MITAVDLVSAENPEYGNLVSAALPFIDHLLLNELEASKVLGLRISPKARMSCLLPQRRFWPAE